MRRSFLFLPGPCTPLRDFLDDKYRRYGITEQILSGDRRPVHRPAVEHGEACGVRTHVFEEGYSRPWSRELFRVVLRKVVGVC